jgi:hypothetical protein
MSAKGWPWSVLDLKRAPETTAEVRRAYAKKLKTIDQARDIAGFEDLRRAYEVALARLEQKSVRKAAPRPELPPNPVPSPAAATPVTAFEIDLVSATPPDDRQSAPAAPAPEVTLPDPGPAFEAPDPALLPPSPGERLQTQLRGLSEKNILLSPAVRVRKLLDDPAFDAPELDLRLRHGLAHYLRSQLMRNHLNEPYLRHPGVTTELLKALDARFGWLSDYSAFRRDFHGDTDLLEAMIDAAGLDRTPPPAAIPARSTGNVFDRLSPRLVRSSALFLVGYFILLRFVVEASARAPDNVLWNGLKVIMVAFVVMFFFGLGAVMIQDSARYMSQRVSRPMAIAAGAALFAVFFLIMFVSR